MPKKTSLPPAWKHYNPVQIVSSSLNALANYVSQDAHVLLVTSKGFVRRGVTGHVEKVLHGRQITIFDEIKPNPDLQDLDAAAMQLRAAGSTAIIGLGGGSALDAAKVLAFTLPSNIPQPLKTVFRGKVDILWNSRLPLIVIPTTSGTGAEVTPFATVWDHEQRRKHSLGSPLMFPDVALLDAELTLTLPEQETLYPGLDTVSHALESLWNRNCTPLSRTLALQALSLAAEALPGVLEAPDNLRRRAKMQWASTLAGMAISQTRTAIAHAISYPVTTYFGVPHGLACSFTLPALLKLNITQLTTSLDEHLLLGKVLEMLESLNLPSRLNKYVKLEQLLLLQNEMITPGRSDNYTGSNEINLTELLQNTV